MLDEATFKQFYTVGYKVLRTTMQVCSTLYVPLQMVEQLARTRFTKNWIQN